MNDPRTMEAAQLRVAVRDHDRFVRGLWLLEAAAFRRIQKEHLFREWGFESLRGYLMSDLPEVEYRTAKRMMQALAYVEEREPEALDVILRGGGAGTPMLPNYTEIARLDSLALKAAKDEVDRDAYESLHRQAFAGEVTGQEVRRRVRELTKPAVREPEETQPEPSGREDDAGEPPPSGSIDASLGDTLVDLLRAFVAAHGDEGLRDLGSPGTELEFAL